jgi:hypothetical protein
LAFKKFRKIYFCGINHNIIKHYKDCTLMTKKLPLAIIALTTFLTFINSKAKCEDYKTIVDDPRAIKNLTIHLDPFYCEVWTTNPTLGFGLRGEYHLGRLASFAFDFRTPYPGTDGQGRIHYDQDLPYPNLEPGGKRGLARFTYTEFGAELHVFDWTKSKSLKVVLASSTSGRTTTTTYIMVPGTKRKVLAARGGFSTIQTAFDVKDTHTSIKGYHGKDTLSFGSYQDTKGGSSVYTGYSNMTMVIIHNEPSYCL